MTGTVPAGPWGFVGAAPAAMVWTSWAAVGRVLLTGLVVYVYVVAILRVSGKRTLAKLNAFDLVVTVALGSVLATVVVSGEVAWSEAFSAVGILILAQYVVARGSVHFRWLRRFAKAEPATLVADGEIVREQLVRARIASDEICQVVRASGFGGLDQIAAVVLETDGSLSVIPKRHVGDHSALPAHPGMPNNRDDEGRPATNEQPG